MSHNGHKNYYESAHVYIQGRLDKCFESEDAKKRAIETDEIWELQWYPETPIGFHIVAAPTFDECIDYANRL